MPYPPVPTSCTGAMLAARCASKSTIPARMRQLFSGTGTYGPGHWPAGSSGCCCCPHFQHSPDITGSVPGVSGYGLYSLGLPLYLVCHSAFCFSYVARPSSVFSCGASVFCLMIVMHCSGGSHNTMGARGLARTTLSGAPVQRGAAACA